MIKTGWFWIGRLIASIVIWSLRGVCGLRGRVRIISRPGDPEYLIRYAVSGWLPGDKPRPRWLPNIYLHNILLPDADPCLHNHPWPWAWSLILRGGYRETRSTQFGQSDRSYTAGQINTLRVPRDFHRISKVWSHPVGSGVECWPTRPNWGGCWTLFVTSGRHSYWGFSVPGSGFVPHKLREIMVASELDRKQQRQISIVHRAMAEQLRELNDREAPSAKGQDGCLDQHDFGSIERNIALSCGEIKPGDV